ncbi:hypothetical protein R1T40_08525 [Tritonibacter scottomollicae]|uniref:ASCH domain-containing protein n=1 Tax=Tritonibacter scottomollicae TaxID=483013 RepID=A0ABZ0HKQ6_TRISK|nr:hypothetical protein [Tritonibacter scottomollicae]WOI34755.1 hypothetical protein R1T40_08525 [Tritonibacter scottomollicae]
MVAYNFQQEFEPDILLGRKLSTIRPNGKRRHAVAGDELQQYVGMRTQSCRLLLRVPCIYSKPIEIHHWGADIDGVGCTGANMEKLAGIEGFASAGNMQAWFDNRYGLPAVGFTQIRWDFAAAIFVAESTTEEGSAP